MVASDIFEGATNGNGDEDHNSMDKLEEETLLQMNSLLPQLSTTHPSTVLMLNSIGLDVVTSKAVQGLHSDVSRMLTAWLHLEERGAVDDSAPDPDDEIGSSPEVHEQAFEKMSVLQRSIVNADLIQSSSNSAQKRSKQRAEYLQKQDDILSQENKANTRARYKADPEKKKASVRDSYKADPEKKKASVRDSYKADPEKKKASVRDSYKADPEKKKASVRDSYKADPEKKKASVRDSYKADPEKKKTSVRDSYKADPEKKKASVRDSYKADPEKKKTSVRDSYRADPEKKKTSRYQEDLEENRAAKRQRYQEDVEENRAAKGRNTRTIQLPLRHLKGIGIGMTPLSDWLNVLPRGSGIAGVTELPLPPKDAVLPPTVRRQQQQSCPHHHQQQSCPHRHQQQRCPHRHQQQSCPHRHQQQSCPHRHQQQQQQQQQQRCPHRHQQQQKQQEHHYSIGTSAPTTTLPAATLAAATTTRMAPMA
eukprot:Em0009g886a